MYCLDAQEGLRLPFCSCACVGFGSVGLCVLLRVPRPLCGLLLDLRKTHSPTDPTALGFFEIIQPSVDTCVCTERVTRLLLSTRFVPCVRKSSFCPVDEVISVKRGSAFYNSASGVGCGFCAGQGGARRAGDTEQNVHLAPVACDVQNAVSAQATALANEVCSKKKATKPPAAFPT